MIPTASLVALVALIVVCAVLPFVDRKSRPTGRSRRRRFLFWCAVPAFAAFQVGVHYTAFLKPVPLGGDVILNTGSFILFPANIVLLHYFLMIRSNAGLRLVPWSVIFALGVNLLLAFVLMTFSSATPPGALGEVWSQLTTWRSVILLVSGDVVFFADFVLLVAFYRFTRDKKWAYLVTVLGPVAVALSFDALVYSAVVWLVQPDAPPWDVLFLNHLGWKLGVGALYGVAVAWADAEKGTSLASIPSPRACLKIAFFLSAFTVPSFTGPKPTTETVTPALVVRGSLGRSQTDPELTATPDGGTSAPVWDESGTAGGTAIMDRQDAAEVFARALPSLLENPAVRGKWVAYTADGPVPDLDPDEWRERLYRRCVTVGLRPGTFEVFQVEPPLETTTGPGVWTLSVSEVPTEIPEANAYQAASRAFAHDLPTLLPDEAVRGKWVAYTADGRVPGLDPDEWRERLYRRCVKAGLRPGTFEVFQVEWAASASDGVFA